jgi:flagellar biogenesis protein FliO
VEHFETARQILSVLLVLGLLAAVALKFGRYRGPRSERRMRVIERLPLTAQHSIHIVAVDGRTFIVGASPSGCQLLDIASDGGTRA